MPESPPTGTPKGAVFLSYASQDAAAAKRLCEALRPAGIEVWFDQEGGLEHGDEWDAKIRRQIRECVLFLPIISANTQAREEGYFRIEWDLAAERAQGIAAGVAFILPILVDDTREPDALVPDRFRKVQWTRLPGGRVPPDVLERFLKLWSHRTGAIRHVAAQAAAPHAAAAPAPAPALRPPRWGAAAAALILLAGVAVWQPWRRAGGPSPAAAPAAPLTEARQLVERARAIQDGTVGKTGDATTGAEQLERSVAVLAFANLSDDRENEYFSDGISEELLTVLQKIPGLRVAARTSSFSFKGKSATAQEIGAALGVANLVEGSVRKAGGQVRITARLSRVATGEETWSESYTRDLKDVFAVQSEIAQTIVGQLRGQLGGGPDGTAAIQAAVSLAEKGGTRNQEAHELFLQGKFAASQFSLQNFRKAIGCFREAVVRDPSYALAWAALSRTITLQLEWSVPDRPFEEMAAEARVAADRALKLEPDLAEAHLAEMEIQASHDYDWKGAAASAREALRLAPSDASCVFGVGRSAFIAGDVGTGADMLRRAIALDPLNGEFRLYLASILQSSGHIPEAEAEMRRALEISPSESIFSGFLAVMVLQQGRFEEAIALAAKDKEQWSRDAALALAYSGEGKAAEADAVLQRLIDQSGNVAAYQVAETYGYRGNADQAFAWLERAVRQHDGGIGWTKTDNLFTGLHGDPRWPAFLRKIGLADDQLK